MTVGGPGVESLKVLKRYLYGDVTLGFTVAEGRVTTTVRLSVDDPAVKDALAPLHALLIERAQSLVHRAEVEREVRAQVAARVEKAVANERSRIRRTALEPVTRALKALDRAQANLSEGASTYDVATAKRHLAALTEGA